MRMTMNSDTVSTYKDRPCRISEMELGNTLFTVISVQSEAAKETAYNKVKKLILDGAEAARKSYQQVHN